MRLEQRRRMRRFTRAMWRALGDVVRCDHVRAADLPAAEVLAQHGFLKDITPRPDGIARATVTGAGLQAWEWYVLRSRAGRASRQALWV
jgi:hypothetical protein